MKGLGTVQWSWSASAARLCSEREKAERYVVMLSCCHVALLVCCYGVIFSCSYQMMLLSRHVVGFDPMYLVLARGGSSADRSSAARGPPSSCAIASELKGTQKHFVWTKCVRKVLACACVVQTVRVESQFLAITADKEERIICHQ